MDWLWQGVVTNGLWWIIVIAGGGVIAILKNKGLRWADPCLYGVVSAAALAMLIFALRAIPNIPSKEQPVTEANLESTIKSWLDKYQLGMQTLPETPQEYFGIRVTSRDGRHLIVHYPRARGSSGYYQIQTDLHVSDKDGLRLKNLSPKDRSMLLHSLRLNMDLQKVSYVGIEDPLTKIGIFKGIAIPGITEHTFLQSMDELERAALVCDETLQKELEARSH